MKDCVPGAAASGRAEDEESKELREFMEELWERIPDYARRAASIKAGAPGSVEWYADIGRFWREEREQTGLSRYQAAESMDVHVNRVRLLEVGVAGKNELDRRFVEGYAEALGKPELASKFGKRFRYR